MLDGWLVVECDSEEFHRGWVSQKRDRRRDLLLAATTEADKQPENNARTYLSALRRAGYVVVLAVRVITLSLSPLEPPLGLVPLTDPGALFFYGGIEVTKDLFFSGHTATAFLIYLCLQERIEKAVALAAVIVLAVMLLIQHIHYTIDVLAAVPITYYCYQLSKRIAAYALG